MICDPIEYRTEDASAVNSALEKKGFVHLSAVFSEDEIRHIEQALDSLANSHNAGLSVFKREMANHEGKRNFLQQEISRPVLLAKELQRSAVFAKCQKIATNLLGSKAHYQYDHAIYKSPFSEAITLWHQDQAYLGERVIFPSIHFWIPLQKTDVNNGTMRFSRINYKSLLPHGPAFEGKAWPLMAAVNEVSEVYEVDAGLGDVSIHTNFTLHSSGKNFSDATRKVWVLHFSKHSSWYKRWLQIKSVF